MKTTKKYFFSMVEVALAVAILAVGATTVVTLIPVGIKQNNDSLGQNYSALFANDAHAYLSNLAKTNWSAISSLPQYSSLITNGIPNSVVTLDQLSGRTKETGTDLYSIAPGVYAVSKSSGENSNGLSPTGQDFSAQIIIWQSGGAPQPAPTGLFNIDITNGTVTLNQPSNFNIKSIGSDFMAGTTHYPVVLTQNVTQPDGTTTASSNPFGTGVATANQAWKVDNQATDTKFTGSAQSTNAYNGRAFDSSNSDQWLILKNGDPVPLRNAASSEQRTIGSLVSPFAVPDPSRPGKSMMKLEPNQVIFCIDINLASSEGISAVDYNDLVYLATVVPTTTYATKTNDITDPSAFTLIDENGKSYTLASMASDPSINYETPQTIKTNSLKIKTSDSINVNGQDVALNGNAVTLNAAEAGSFNVQVWKEGTQWHTQILDGSKTTIAADNGSTLNLPRLTAKQNRVGINTEISWPLAQTNYEARNKLRYYFEVYDMESIGK